MTEKSYFSVDNTGEAEYHEAYRFPKGPRPPVRFTAELNKEAVIPIGGVALTVEEIGDHRYFGEPGGRIIDTQTGKALTHGDGRMVVNLVAINELVREHQQNN